MDKIKKFGDLTTEDKLYIVNSYSQQIQEAKIVEVKPAMQIGLVYITYLIPHTQLELAEDSKRPSVTLKLPKNDIIAITLTMVPIPLSSDLKSLQEWMKKAH